MDLSYFDIPRTPLDAGRWFHDWLTNEKARLGVSSPDHPDDDDHNIGAGTTLLSCLNGAPDTAPSAYNEWAAEHGYAEMVVICTDPMAIDIRDGVVVWYRNSFVYCGVTPGDPDCEWRVSLAQRDGEDLAIVLTRGAEFHATPLDVVEALPLGIFDEHLASLIEAFGFATARSPVNAPRPLVYERIGFFYTWADGVYDYWMR